MDKEKHFNKIFTLHTEEFLFHFLSYFAGNSFSFTGKTLKKFVEITTNFILVAFL